MPIDHISIPVSDYEKSREFYLAALAPLGYKVIKEVPDKKVCGLGNRFPEFWIGECRDKVNAVAGKGAEKGGGVHLAFFARSRSQVDAFHAAALKAGGKDNGAPGLRTQYHPNYYGAFVYDFDGYNVEVVSHCPGWCSIM